MQRFQHWTFLLYDEFGDSFLVNGGLLHWLWNGMCTPYILKQSFSFSHTSLAVSFWIYRWFTQLFIDLFLYIYIYICDFIAAALCNYCDCSIVFPHFLFLFPDIFLNLLNDLTVKKCRHFGHVDFADVSLLCDFLTTLLCPHPPQLEPFVHPSRDWAIQRTAGFIFKCLEPTFLVFLMLS